MSARKQMMYGNMNEKCTKSRQTSIARDLCIYQVLRGSRIKKRNLFARSQFVACPHYLKISSKFLGLTKKNMSRTLVGWPGTDVSIVHSDIICKNEAIFRSHLTVKSHNTFCFVGNTYTHVTCGELRSLVIEGMIVRSCKLT